MKRSHAAGVTLVELLVTVILFGTVSAIALRLLTLAHRETRWDVERGAVLATTRAATTLLASELRELGVDAAGADVLAMATSDLTYRAARYTGIACAVGSGAVTVRRTLQFGYRAPAPSRDSLLLFVDGDPATAADDRWRVLPLLAAGAAGNCPDGTPAIVLPTVLDPDTAALVVLDAPVRAFEVTQLRLYQSGGLWWIGIRSVSAGEAQVQPAVGPFAANGLEFRFLDRTGVVTSMPAAVRSAEVILRALSERRVIRGFGSPGKVPDSVVTRVGFRNAPRD